MLKYCLRDSSFSTGTEYGLDDWESRIQFAAGSRDSDLIWNIQTGFGASQLPIQWVLRAFSDWRGNAAGMWSWPSTSSYLMLNLIVHKTLPSHPHMSMWCGAEISSWVTWPSFLMRGLLRNKFCKLKEIWSGRSKQRFLNNITVKHGDETISSLTGLEKNRQLHTLTFVL